MIRVTQSIFVVITFVFLLISCGGGDSDSNDDGGQQQATGIEISGAILAPSNSIALLDRDIPAFQATLDFVIPPAWSAITGLTPVANAVVELIRIDDDGGQVGGILETTTSDSSGTYTLELPVGVGFAANLIVQIKDSANQPVLRAVVSGETVNVDPVSEFILETLINEPGVVMANININSVQDLVNQAGALNLDFTTAMTLEDANTAIATSDDVNQLVDNEVAAVANTALIVGAWGGDNETFLLALYSNGLYVHWQDCTDTSDGVGVEYGTYDYDGTTFSATPAFDQNGGCGLSEWLSFTVTADDTELSYENGNDQGTISRVNGGPDSIVGGWDVRNSALEPMAIVFFEDGSYIQYEAPNNDDDVCALGGVEYGSYTFDGSVISGSITVDNNNDCGLGEGPGPFTLAGVTVSNNQLSFDDESVDFARVEISQSDFAGSGGNSDPGETVLGVIPDAFISVDGLADDWANVPAVVVDPVGDQNGNTSTDLVSLKAAKDFTMFYLLMETSGNIAFPHTPAELRSIYDVGIYFFSDGNCTNLINGDDSSIVAYNHTTSSGENTAGLGTLNPGIQAATTTAAGTNFLETAFSLSEFPSNAQSMDFIPMILVDHQGGGSTIYDEQLSSCYQVPTF